MRTAIIGNSHAGTVYTAWRTHQQQGGGLEADFYIERSHGQEPLTLTRGTERREFEDVLVLPRSVLPTEDYDSFVLVGLGLGLHAVASLYRSIRSDRHTLGDRQLVSEACFRQTAVDTLAATKAVRVARALRELSDRPVLVVPQPHAAWWVPDVDRSPGDLYRALEANDDLETLSADYAGAAASFDEVTVLPQPPATVLRSVYTAPTFTLGDPADAGEGSSFARGDFYHGNLAWATAVVELLESSLPGA